MSFVCLGFMVFESQQPTTKLEISLVVNCGSIFYKTKLYITVRVIIEATFLERKSNSQLELYGLSSLTYVDVMILINMVHLP